ncbi:MAG: carbon-nitrogen hydrolase family protein [Phycisphaerae bacterium]|jgi:predicted amidohydrolase|nr:carbon-nitrogen hydrolase family protein [Phycisphaerae bacterium]
MKIRVAGAQLPVTDDVEANAAEISRAIDFASDEKADILLTPEGSLSGYTHKIDTAATTGALARVTGKAKAANLGLALGTCFVEPEDGKCYNQLRFYTPDGEYLGFHSKTLRCGSLDVPSEGEINDYAVAPLRTFQFAGAKIAGLICNDLWVNPQCSPQPDTHLTQHLSRMGTRVIFHAVNGGRDGGEWSREVAWPYHEMNLRMRARAGGLWVVTVDNCQPTHLPCSAPSGIINPAGNWVCRAEPKGLKYFAHTIDLTAGNDVQ